MTTSTQTRSRKSNRTKARKDVYQIVTDKIVEALDAGTIPWRKTWKGGVAGRPTNLKSNKPYRGVNAFLLSMVGAQYDSPYWLTFKQAKELGGAVRKGEKGTPVVFWKPITPKDGEVDESGKPKRGGMVLRYYTVFNFEQTDDVRIPKGRITVAELLDGGEVQDVESFAVALSIFNSYTKRESIAVKHGGGRAQFSPMLDAIQMPKLETFEEFLDHLVNGADLQDDTVAYMAANIDNKEG